MFICSPKDHGVELQFILEVHVFVNIQSVKTCMELKQQ